MATHQQRNPNPISFLPEEIISNIFLRLPVKDLLRSKSVCKSWLSLICSPHFVKTHLSKSTNDPDFTHHRLLLSYWPLNSNFQLKSYSIYSLLNEPVNKIVGRDYPDRVTSVVGYCNGLICLESYDNYVFFWNPSTRKSRRLPKIDTISPRCMLIRYGFCYDESNDAFKVFAISTYDWKHKLSVYSSRSDSWRLIGDFASATVWYGGYFVNGALHWVVCPDGQLTIRRSVSIVSLDIKTDTYREVLLPNCGEDEYNWTMGTFSESLSVLCKFENTGVELWVMKECDVEESWTKLFTIPYMDGLTHSKYLKPICISVNGDIMLHLDSTIVLYNSKDQTFKDLLNISFRNLQLYTYVESLVSPCL